ncbi:MAG TPA: hypothetical protein QGF41_02085 [Gammaproteobacteria bacterium]|jgi:hypothetical protein|nr:hypothetical protein [Candidatus Latescibacterota bacterium]HJN94486.1 hypothetical protein [Gammaproteobacteria bacterium]
MNNRILNTLSLAIVSLLVAPALIAQTSDIPRTEYGVPDFQGTYTYRTLTPLSRPRELSDKEVLTEEEAIEWQAFENRRQNRDLIIDSVGGAGYPPGVISYNNFWYERGIETIADRRTSLIYDPPNGRMPPTNAAGRQRRAEISEMRRLSAGPEARSLADRCLLMGGLPMTSGAYNNNMQLIQTRDHIVIVNEMIHRARIIRLDSEHHTRQLKWSGDSVAHWEGDTLVIHTQHFYQNQNGRGSSASMQLEERLSWIDENTLDYDFTMQDPETWDVSWSARLPMRRIEDPLFEYACHEGNHGLPGILAGWRRYETMGMNGDGTPKE